jgi:mRNA interferase RelE/StbE
MASYEVVFSKSVARDLRRIPNKDVRRILDRIAALAADPRCEGCIKLSVQDRYRVRQGLYRIVYEIRDRELLVVVVKVAHRRDVYRGS